MRSSRALSWCGLVFLCLSACDGRGGLPPERPVAAVTTTGSMALGPQMSSTDGSSEPRSPAGLLKWLGEYDRLVATNGSPSQIAQARAAVDHMAAQRDAHLSRLYWYTDLEGAKTEAKRTGRPILSLRLLGRLDEELSCANSRLFRMVLYSNESTAQFLRDTYVLHWSSERPAPQVTLDFGDGRVVKRTITGNSVHYVLDSQGRVIDALPGMYGPARFERTLRETIGLARDSGALDDAAASKATTKHHQHMVWALTSAWRRHLSDAYTNTYPDYVEKASLPTPAKMAWTDPLHDSLPASAVNELTYSKADMEAPTLSLLQPTVTVLADFGPWQKVMQGIPAEHLSNAGRELLREQHPRDWSTRETQPLDEAKLAKTIARFEQRVTDEGFRNEFMMHGSVHVVLARPGHLDFASTNDFVYSRLFMTPKDDGWLGLAPTDAVTGLSDDGIVSTQ